MDRIEPPSFGCHLCYETTTQYILPFRHWLSFTTLFFSWPPDPSVTYTLGHALIPTLLCSLSQCPVQLPPLAGTPGWCNQRGLVLIKFPSVGVCRKGATTPTQKLVTRY